MPRHSTFELKDTPLHQFTVDIMKLVFILAIVFH